MLNADGSTPNSATQDSEQRRFTRVSFVNHIVLKKGDTQWNGTVVDISFNGVLISCDSDIALTKAAGSADIVDAIIHFENDDYIMAKLELAHHHGKLYGFSLHEIDSDSLAHLRNIIEHNLIDSSVCERELLTLFRYHQ
ncbi:hypothetical protein IMCC1989_770 [gamma proteobacterium IMCC1989]|nr:hypothetical protein IMCC1989_770 [gamma proteobacterium IMCC1989]